MVVRVLLVDGHTRVREALRLFLDGEADIRVAAAVEDRQEAARKIEQLRPDVVVMDYSVLEVGELEAVRQITHSSPRTRVLVLSLCASEEHLRQASQMGATGWLLKESVASEIATAIRMVARGEQYYPQTLELNMP